MRTVLVPLIVLVSCAACGKKSDAPAPAPDPKAPPVAPAPPAAAVAVDAAPPVAVDAVAAVAPPDAEADVNPRTSPLCSKVLEKLVECQKDKEFLEALNEGVDPPQLKLNKRFLKEVARWKDADTNCMNLAPGIEYMGFLDHWDRIVAVPDLVDSCGKLGTMINAAGGLFGGDKAF